MKSIPQLMNDINRKAVENIILNKNIRDDVSDILMDDIRYDLEKILDKIEYYKSIVNKE